MIKECPECFEIFTGSYYFIDLVMDVIYSTLALKCPNCNELIGLKINEEGDVEKA